nr:DEAD/DEAH box helicase [bacterium]
MSTDTQKYSNDSVNKLLVNLDEEKVKTTSKELLTEIAIQNKRSGNNYQLDLGQIYRKIRKIVEAEIKKPDSTDYSIKKAVDKIDLNLYKLSSSQTNSDQSNNNKESEKKVTEKLQSNKINNNKDIQNAKVELPIDKFKEEIVEKVKNNQTVIISAETGAGKSTRVAQYLAEQGTSVIITETTKVSTESLTTRVAEEMHSFVGSKEIDYRHGEKKSDSNPKILFCTDGLQLVRELTSTKKAKVLIIDEVHEWNTNIETLIAWSKKRQQEEPDFKLILM